MILKTLTLTACLTPALLAQAAAPLRPNDIARTMRFVPTGGFEASSARTRPVPLPPFITSEDYERPTGLLEFARTGSPGVESDQIQDLVYGRFSAAMDDDRLAFDAGGGGIRIWGQAEEVEAASAYVAALEAALVPRLRVEAWLLPVADGRVGDEATPVFGPEDVATRTGALWHAAATVAAGQAIDLGDWRRTPIVRRVNTEVAQDSSIANPVVTDVLEGVRVAVEAHALAGSSDLVLFGQCAVAELRSPVRTEPTGLPGQPSIDVPELDDHAATFSARVRDGGGCVVWHGGHASVGGRMALVVRVQRIDGGAGQIDGISVMPVGALTRRGIDRRVICTLDTWNGEPEFGREQSGQPLSEDTVAEVVHATLGDAVDDGRAEVRVVGHSVVVSADAAGRNAALAAIRQLEDELLVNVGVVLRTEAEDGRVLHEVAIPALAGRPHFSYRGVETTGIRTVNSEIAQGAAILVPAIENRFGGQIASFTPQRSATGIHVDAQIDLLVMGSERRRTLEGEHGGALTILTSHHARFSHAGPLQRRSAVDLGSGPRVDGMRTSQSIEIR